VSKQTAGATAAVAGAPLLLDAGEAAQMLGVSKMTVYRNLRSGDWPGGRCGRKHLVLARFVYGFIDQMARGRKIDIDEYARAAFPSEAPPAEPRTQAMPQTVASVLSITRAAAPTPADAALSALPLLEWIEAAADYPDMDERVALLVSQPADADPAVILAAAQAAYAARGES
jgi:excisionase family DNA binding protein